MVAGERTALGRAITLVESRNPAHRTAARALLNAIAPRTGRAQRIGITGVPGVGKSTFIDAFGTVLTELGRRVAVLAVDPSSTRSGGSILGDKTRMQRLSVDPAAFVRPSPSAGTLGGVTRATRETMALCEAAGFDVILVETVGVGQSEVAVAGMVDFFLVLMLPGAGDELQGIKKGLLEIADMIAVNKADGDNRARAEEAAAEYSQALRIVTPAGSDWRPPVLTCSALHGEGLPALWARIEEHAAQTAADGSREARRRHQRIDWMWDSLRDQLLARLENDARVTAAVPGLEARVAEGDVIASVAGEQLLDLFLGFHDHEE
ncbi:MAG: methylmalonyl Co-A mutase-associated GTPase MeaB [Alphaproteobacteria bacterium]|nr:methylmalonyl Co-A mutase-associated GTPase MeaB [Alphaproteobacteria bacterium]